MRDIRECIVYEDDDICVCHKPSGVLTQSDRGFSQDMVSALMTYERKKGVKAPFIAPVNRLDSPVEGLVLYAKNSRSAAALTGQITSGEVDKCYYAVVNITGGNSMEDMQKKLHDREMTTLEDYLLKDSKTNMSKVVPENTQGAKKAVLEYQVLDMDTDGKRAFLKVKLHTGRHHQIRVQLANAGLPILDDAKYSIVCDTKHGIVCDAKYSIVCDTKHGRVCDAKHGSVNDIQDSAVSDTKCGGGDSSAGDSFATVKKNVAGKHSDNLALCSYRLVFTHPVTKKKLVFEIEPKGKSFMNFMEKEHE